VERDAVLVLLFANEALLRAFADREMARDGGALVRRRSPVD